MIDAVTADLKTYESHPEGTMVAMLKEGETIQKTGTTISKERTITESNLFFQELLGQALTTQEVKRLPYNTEW